MSYYRGYHGGRGGMMSNFGGSNRFGILPVTRPRMQGGMYNQNRPSYGGGRGGWNNNFRQSVPRNSGPSPRNDSRPVPGGSPAKPSADSKTEPATSAKKGEEPKADEAKKEEPKKTEEAKKAEDPKEKEKDKEKEKEKDKEKEKEKEKDKGKDAKAPEAGKEKDATPKNAAGPSAPVKDEPMETSAATTPKPETTGPVASVKQETPTIKLCTYNSELHMCISPDQSEAWNMTGPGFEYMWGGVRATHGVAKGKVCFEVHLLENIQVNCPEEKTPHVVRVGWSVDGSDYQLGEDKLSWGYGGTGKSVYESKFRDYGKPFGVGDVIMCYVDLDANPKAMFFMVNGQYLGVAFRFTNELNGQAVYPHVACKNMKFKVNFGQQPPAHPLTSNFRMMQSLSADEVISPPAGPLKAEQAEMIMMVGLPACGKSVWCENYAREHKDKKYYILGTNLIIDRMKVSGLIRKRNYHGRWEELIKRASAVLNKLFDVAKKRPRNYILDQTNVYFTARRRKMESFRGYKRIAAVIVNTPDVLDLRTEKQRKDEGKLVPEEAVMEMKKNFSLPEVGPSFDDVWYLEEKLPVARTLVESYRAEGIAFKNKRPFSGQGGPTPTPINEPPGKKTKTEDTRGQFNNRNVPPRDQHAPRPMDTNSHEPPKTDSRNQPRDSAPKRDERPDSRKDDRDKDRRRDRSGDRGRDSHRDDKRAPPRDDRRDSRGDRRDAPRSDRREPPSRDGREPPRDGRDPSREGRDPTRDSREPPRDLRDSPRDGREPPRDNRGLPRDNREPPRDNRVPPRDGSRDMQRDNRDAPPQDLRGPRGMQEPPPRDLRDPARDREPPYGDRREPPRDMRREPPRDLRGEFPPRDDRRDFRDRGMLDRDGRPPVPGPANDELGPEMGRAPPPDMRTPIGRDDRGYPRDAYRGRDDRDGRMPYNEPLEQGRRYAGNDWRDDSFQDEYRTQYADDKAETFRRDLPFGRDYERLREEGYYDDPRERDPASNKFPFQNTPVKAEENARGDYHGAGGLPPRAGGAPPARGPGGYGESMGYGPPADRFGRPDEKPPVQGYGMPSYRDERYPVDPARREGERPGMGAPRSLLDDPLKVEKDVPMEVDRNRFDGRPPAPASRDAPPAAGAEFGYGRPPARAEGEYGGYRDYSHGYNEQDKGAYGGRGDVNRSAPEAARYDGRGDPIKAEPGRPEPGRYDQGRYEQGRPGPEQGWSGQQPSWPEPGRPDGPPAAGSKSLMDIPVSDYAKRAEYDQKLYDQKSQDPRGYDQRAYDKNPVDEKPRYDQSAYGAGQAGDYSNPYSYPPKSDYAQKPDSRYDQGYSQEKYDSYGKPVDPHASQDRSSIPPSYGNQTAESWKAPPKSDAPTGRYDNASYYNQGAAADRWGSQEQSAAYYQQGAADRPNTYRDPTTETGRYPSQQPAPSSIPDSYNQPGRDPAADPTRAPGSQYPPSRNPYGSEVPPPAVSAYEQPAYAGASVSTTTPANKSYGYSLTTSSTQNYSNTNDRMSYSYQTQMTTSTANYGQAQSLSGGASAYQAQRYTTDTGARPSESSVPPTQPYGRSAGDTAPASVGSAPQDNYAGSASQSTYEQQQQDYQKAYKQWYANYAQAYAQLAQQQPK